MPRTSWKTTRRIGRPMDQVRIFDTTLRDGEQSPGISLDVGEKLEIAEQLARLGVDIIEAGFPIASQGDFEAVEAIAKSVRGSTIAGLSRTGFKDVDRAWEAVRHAERPRIHVFIATSPDPHEEEAPHDRGPGQGRGGGRRRPGRRATATTSSSRPRTAAARTPTSCARCARSRSTTARPRSTSPTPSGSACPRSSPSSSRTSSTGCSGDYVVSTHCHNDLGLAVANSLAGRAGRRPPGGVRDQRARRAGRQRRARGDRDGDQDAAATTSATSTSSVRTEELARTSRIVSRLTGYPVQYNKAVVGRNAFAHEAGIHQHGVLEDPETYEIMDANTVGQEAAQIVLGKHSGRHAFADSLGEDGHPDPGRRAERGVHPVQGARRPQGADHRGRPRGDRGRGARHRRTCTGSTSSSLDAVTAARRRRRRPRSCCATATARSTPRPPATG